MVLTFVSSVTAAAAKIIEKWLKKGNMAARMRDVLPKSGLSLEEREEVAGIVHNAVRWKKWYDFLIDHYSLPEKPETYVRLANSGDIWESAEKAVPKHRYTEIRYSFSPYMAELIDSEFPELRGYLNREPEAVLMVNFNRANKDEVKEALKSEGLRAEDSVLESAVVSDSRARYSEAVKEGRAQVQDESSQLIAKICASKGESILDYCAGNGVKTIAMASFKRNAGSIFAWDIDPKKRHIIRRRAGQYGADINVLERPDGEYDAVLVDAPCTGAGSARRNPEAKYTDAAGDFPEIQLSILKEAKERVKHGGYLVYCVCSFTPEETVDVAERFLSENFEFREERIKSRWLKRMEYGYLTDMPEGDVMYLCLMRRS